MRSRAKLIPGIVIFLIIIAFLIVMLFWSMGRTDWRQKRVELSFDELQQLISLRDTAGGQTRQAHHILQGKGTEAEFNKSTEEANDSFNKLEDTVEQMISYFGEEEKEELSKLESLEEEYQNVNRELEDVIRLYKEGRSGEAIASYDDSLERYQDIFLPKMSAMITGEMSAISHFEEDAKRAAVYVKTLAWIILGLAVIVAIFVTVVLSYDKKAV